MTFQRTPPSGPPLARRLPRPERWGCVLAVLYHYSRSLWPCIVVHGLSNTIAILVVVLGHVRC